MTKILTASRFKAQCLALLDEVAETGESLVVTKHGRPVARVAPLEAPASLRGSVTFNASDEELIAPLGETWDAAPLSCSTRTRGCGGSPRPRS